VGYAEIILGPNVFRRHRLFSLIDHQHTACPDSLAQSSAETESL
jgi:hypothetical protein